MKKFKILLSLFFTMLKIGLFTFGGGYAMVSIMQTEFVEKKKWITNGEFTDYISISESTPGPLAINSSTFIGYKIGGVLGAIFATLGTVLPSFIIIFIISLFFDDFLSLEYVGYAFKGIQVCVVFLIISAGIRFFKSLQKNVFNVIMFSLSVIVVILFTLFSINFSTIFIILIAGFIGVLIYLLSKIKNKKNDNLIKTEDREVK